MNRHNFTFYKLKLNLYYINCKTKLPLILENLVPVVTLIARHLRIELNKPDLIKKREKMNSDKDRIIIERTLYHKL